MRRVYLIRHGDPGFPGGKRMCLGTTDLGLGPLGRMRAALTGADLADKGIATIFASDLKRAQQTAEYVGSPVIVRQGFREASQGEWEGHTFEEIARLWPELYTRRATDTSVPPPGAEPYSQRIERFSSALAQALCETEGDVAVVAHGGVIMPYLGSLLGKGPREFMTHIVSYGSVSELAYANGSFEVLAIGRRPHPELDDSLCLTLLGCAGAPARVVEHCKAVAQEARRIAGELAVSGVGLDASVIGASALLHDVARAQQGHDLLGDAAPSHDLLGAAWLESLGYPRCAQVISKHMDIGENPALDEEAVIYIADKLVCGSATVALEERFAASEAKCVTPEAKAAHEGRKQQAFAVAKMINEACGKEVVA